MMNTFGVDQIASSGYVAHVDQSLCKGCGTCLKACQFNANALADGKSVMNWEACFGCGQCASKCPNGARSLVLDERKGLPFDVRTLA
jgi:heterodisulfide reductase subunit A-like polyferredoxin